MVLEDKVTLLHELVDRQAARTPQAVAAVAGGESLTYAELSQRSNAVAAALVQMGVTYDDLIGVCVERSLHMLVAVLGILKAGAAYVPLDPNYPDERLAFMVSNAAVQIVVAQRAVINRIAMNNAQTLLLEEIDYTRDLLIDGQSIQTHNLAYAMYTSGSTGQPKGVLIEHRNVVPFIEWTGRYFLPSQFRYTLCANSLSFDVSVFEIFATLAAGGTLVIVKNILELLTAPPCEPLTMIIAAPSSVAEIVRAKAIPVTIDSMIFGGERLPHMLVRELYDTTSVQTIYNSWGVTEDTIGSAFIRVARNVADDPPMGDAIEGRYLYLLNAAGREVAADEPGELYCGGYGVARGYVNRPDLHAARFLPNPFGHSETMYRSGDIATRSADGAFAFVGRNDQQVKLHGFRIELGEIEACLHAHPQVAQAAVIARTSAGRLDMYVVPREGESPKLTVLQSFLAERLPAHMIPAVLHVLPSMPIGPTGKIDRAALAEIEQVQEPSANDYQAPTTEMERTIVALFETILEINRVGITDDFFRLGGKSLLAARLGTEIRQAYPQEVAALELLGGASVLQTAFAFEPTPRYLAAVLQKREQIPKHRESLYCIQPGRPDKPPLFLFHGVINGEALYCYDLARALGKDQPFYALAPHGLDGSDAPDTIEHMARDYVVKIRQLQAHGPYHFMGYCNGGLVAFEAAQQLQAAGEEVATLVLIASPGHNVRHRSIKALVDLVDGVLGRNPQRSLRWFVQSRDSVRLMKYQFEYLRDSTARLFGNKRTPVKARERLRQVRSLGPPAQSENASFRNIMQAVQAYVPQRYAGAISVVWGKRDAYLDYANPHDDWKCVTANLHIDYVDGDHHFLNTDAERLLAYLPFERQAA